MRTIHNECCRRKSTACECLTEDDPPELIRTPKFRSRGESWNVKFSARRARRLPDARKGNAHPFASRIVLIDGVHEVPPRRYHCAWQRMTRAELIRKEAARSKVYGRAFWTLGFAVLGGIIAIPSIGQLSASLGALTGGSWLVPLIVGVFAISIWNQSRMSRCPRCGRLLNGPVAIATDRCGHCGEIAVDDPRLKGN